MTSLAPVVAGLSGIPLGWFASVLIERVPDYEHRVFTSPFRLAATPRGKLIAVSALLVAVNAALAIRFERPADLLPYLGYALVMVVLAVIDLDTLRLPDRLVLPALAVSVPLLV